jgi:TetR/AcrR family transcriptional repressor of bet genes
MSQHAKPADAAPKSGEKLSRLRQRQKLIDACISALHQHGPSRTTIDKVVAIADMSPGIVNFYFETKAALLVAALEFLAVEFEEKVLLPLAALRQTPVLALQRLVDLYLDPGIASTRKVSVWYAFWGEASARHEYYDICGKRDQAFGELVRDLMARLIANSGATHLDPEAVALGLIGSLEMIWQSIAFQDESDIDREAARRRCLAYLASIFPAQFAPGAQVPGAPAPAVLPVAAPADDACRLLVAAEILLAGLHAVALPAGWPGAGVVARTADGALQCIAVVQARPGALPGLATDAAHADWLAVVMQPAGAAGARRIFIIPRHALTDYQTDEAEHHLAPWEDNFRLAT